MLSKGPSIGPDNLPRPIAQAEHSGRELSFPVGTPLEEIERRVIQRDAHAHRRRQAPGRAAARHRDPHHLPQARRGRSRGVAGPPPNREEGSTAKSAKRFNRQENAEERQGGKEINRQGNAEERQGGRRSTAKGTPRSAKGGRCPKGLDCACELLSRFNQIQATRRLQRSLEVEPPSPWRSPAFPWRLNLFLPLALPGVPLAVKPLPPLGAPRRSLGG